MRIRLQFVDGSVEIHDNVRSVKIFHIDDWFGAVQFWVGDNEVAEEFCFDSYKYWSNNMLGCEEEEPVFVGLERS